jgi:YD repeat-containing protein
LTSPIVLRLEWDDNTRAAAVIDAANHRTRYTYDTLNRRNAAVYPDGTACHIQHDAAGNVASVLDANGTRIVSTYDAANRLIARGVQESGSPPAKNETFQYDGLGRIVSAITNGVVTVRDYDSLSQLLVDTQAGRSVRYTYSGAGNPTRVLYPSGQLIERDYDLFNRVTQIRAAGAPIAQYTYRAGFQRSSSTLGGLLQVAYSYEPVRNRLQEIIYQSSKDGTLVDGTRYVYDTVGNRLLEGQLRSGNAAGEQYFYDAANRLVQVRYGATNVDDLNSTFQEEVQYDLTTVGTWQQRTTIDSKGSVANEAGAIDQRDAYANLGSRQFHYDANGNRISESGGVPPHTLRRSIGMTTATGSLAGIPGFKW